MLAVLLLTCCSLLPTYVEKGTLTVEIQNIEETQGMIWLGVYRSAEDFLVKERSILVGEKVAQGGKMIIEIPNLEYGDYAFAVFHDENNNGTMDQNLVGIPSEPFAFSRKPPSRFRLPRFEEVKFKLDKKELTIEAALKKWWQSDKS